MKISGQLVDVKSRSVYPARIDISGGRIADVTRTGSAGDVYIMPGLIDAHIHIESSMVTPGAFGFEAVKHGTVAVVADPHEIANVVGMQGIEYMLEDASGSPVKFWFGAPSCVPATEYESSGGRITAEDIGRLLKRAEIKYLSEMMNYPGVIYGDKEVLEKLRIAESFGKPVDGHAPGLGGEDLKKYVEAGITTDHECSTLQEAREKAGLGMKILIREGSAARNLEALKELYRICPDQLMLCSDDLHPEMLYERHINKLISGLVSEGYDLFDVVRSATLNPSEHYGLDAGLLSEGDSADFIIVDSPSQMNILETWINGIKVFDRGRRSFSYIPGTGINNFKCSLLKEKDLEIEAKTKLMRVIVAHDGELLTNGINIHVRKGKIVETDPDNDLLKIVVKDRYRDKPPSAGFIRGFELREGAFASSVAHDSHNIVAIGTNDSDLARVINEIVRLRGGLAAASGNRIESLQLNIGGIMSTDSCREVSGRYNFLNELVKDMGCTMKSPFMTMSFMALLVIPELKIGDHGLFDVNEFKPVSMFI